MVELLIAPKTPNPYEAAITEVWRLIKFHNPTVLLSITSDDLKFLASELTRYPIEIVQEAKETIKIADSLKSLTLGVLMDKCDELLRAKKANEMTADRAMEKRLRVTADAKRRLESKGFKDPRTGGIYDFEAARKYDEMLLIEEQLVAPLY